MTKITRTNEFARDENGSEWFQDFLKSFAAQPTTTPAQKNSVQNVVEQYRQMVGLDLVAQEEPKESLMAQAENELVKKDISLSKDDIISKLFSTLNNYSRHPGFVALKKPTKIDNSLYFTIRVDSELVEKISKDLIDTLGFVLESNGITKETDDYFISGYLSDDPERSWSQVTDEPGDWESTTKESPDDFLSGYNLNFIISKKTKKASSSPLSVRQAKENVVLLIEKNPNVKKNMHSLCEHSGGNKDTYSIINFLREALGKDLVSYSDDDLVKYIEDTKSKYKTEIAQDSVDVGKVGLDATDTGNDIAEYVMHGKGR